MAPTLRLAMSSLLTLYMIHIGTSESDPADMDTEKERSAGEGCMPDNVNSLLMVHGEVAQISSSVTRDAGEQQQTEMQSLGDMAKHVHISNAEFRKQDKHVKPFSAVESFVEKLAKSNQVPTDAEKETIKLFKEYLDRFEEFAQAEFDENQMDLIRLQNIVVKCEQDFEESEGPTSLAETRVASEKTAHAQCRSEETQLEISSTADCQVFEAYRKAGYPEDLKDNDYSYVETDDAAEFGHLDNIINKKFKFWSDMKEKKDNCRNGTRDHEGKRRECNEHQEIYEEAYCAHYDKNNDACAAYQGCRPQAVADFMDANKSVALIDPMRTLNFLAVAKIRCWMNVLEIDDLGNKTQKAGECKNVTLTGSYKAIVYPVLPSERACEAKASDPCHESWMNKEYTSESWYANAPTTSCSRSCTEEPTPAPTPAPTLAPTKEEVWLTRCAPRTIREHCFKQWTEEECLRTIDADFVRYGTRAHCGWCTPTGCRHIEKGARCMSDITVNGRWADQKKCLEERYKA